LDPRLALAVISIYVITENYNSAENRNAVLTAQKALELNS